MFDFATRYNISGAMVDQLRHQVYDKCATPCKDGPSRSTSCACYAEFASRYWLRLGSFPPAVVDFTTLKASFGSPVAQDAIDRWLTQPDRARSQGWSAVVAGPPRSGKTSLATHLAKKVMAWEIVQTYSSTTRAIYFTARDYASWLRKMEDFKRTENEVDYYEGALLSSVVVWDDVDPLFANDPRFVADVKKRLAARLPLILVLSQDPALYQGSLLAQLFGYTVEQNGEIRMTAAYMMPVLLQGEVMAQTGWA